MEAKIISIIIPVYNVQDYLEECIQSVLKQSFKSFEVVLIDDGSTDYSGEICDKYARVDPRIRVFHKSNGGLSDARNFGIEHAKGRYLMFLDSDDYIANRCLEILLDTLLKQKVDIVQGLFTRDESKLDSGDATDITLFKTQKDVLINYLKYNLLEGHACNKLYKARLFENIRYPVGKIQEDAWTTYKVFYEAKGVCFINYNSYYYRYNNQSIMNGSFDVRRFEILRVPKHIADYLEQRKAGFSFEKELSYFSMRLGLKTYNDCIQHNAESKFKEEMIKTRQSILQLPIDYKLWGRKYITMVALLRVSPRVYKYAAKYLRKNR